MVENVKAISKKVALSMTEDSGLNVLMIVSDTVRADYLGVNGGHVHTPNLDALAKSSVQFRNAWAASFPTVPARADYFTGTYAFTDIGWGPMPQELPSVAQLIAESGEVLTAGVVDTPYLVLRGFNYDRGFQFFYDLPTQDVGGLRMGDRRIVKRGVLVPRPRVTEFDLCAPATMTVAEQCLEKLVDQRFFLYVDTWDPHEPWDPPAWYVKRYKPDYDGRLVAPVYGPYADSGLSDDDFETAWACYSGELEMTDRWIGRLLERLDSLGLAESTAVVFASDHGFYFGEHGGLLGKMVRAPGAGDIEWLRSPLYPECAHVPVFVRIPGEQPRVDDRLISAIDMAPTLLDLFGVQPPAHMLGRSLLPLVRDQSLPGNEITVTAMPLASPGDGVRVVDDVFRSIREWQPISVREGSWLLLFSRWSDPIELYDLESDPGCSTDVADSHPEVVRTMHEKLIAELRRAGASEDAIAARS